MRIMVIGASSDRGKFGNRALRAYRAQGHEVVPINPGEASVEGLQSYATVAAAPGDFDRALVYVPPGVGIGIMRELGARGGVREVWLNPGADEPEVIDAARRAGLQVVQACALMALGE